jgi:hypothetical protein
MRQQLLVLCAIVVALLATSASATRVRGVGFNMDRAPLTLEQPHATSGIDTTGIAPPGFREAQLVCDATSPVLRVATCEIHTFDLCGNIDGDIDGNTTNTWEVSVDAVIGGRRSVLVSPIAHARTGVARFYFTPIVVGLHLVKVWRRSDKTAMASLQTAKTMTEYVKVHDSLMNCMDHKLSEMPRIVQQHYWAQASFFNERVPITGIEPATSPSTFTNVDTQSTHTGANIGKLQQKTGRAATQPFVPDAIGALPTEDNNHFKFCDYVQRSAQ